MIRNNGSRSIRRRKVSFVPSARGVMADMRLETRSLAAPGLIRPIGFSLLDSRSSEGNAQAGQVGLDLALSSSHAVADAVLGHGPVSPGAPPAPGGGGGTLSPDVSNLPEFFFYQNPPDVDAAVGDDVDDGATQTATAAGTVTTTNTVGFEGSDTLQQVAKAQNTLLAPTSNSGTGMNPISATYTMNIQQAVTGQPVGGMNEIEPSVSASDTTTMDSTGPNGYTGWLVEDIKRMLTGPAPNGADVALVGGGGISTNNFSASWFAGAGMDLTSHNMGSMVLVNNPGEITIATPVTLPVYPTVAKFSISYSSDVEVTLTGNVVATNAETETMTYSAKLQATA
jgi:hypothetical protein